MLFFTESMFAYIGTLTSAALVAAAMKDLESVVGPERLRALKATLTLIAAQARESSANGPQRRRRAGTIA